MNYNHARRLLWGIGAITLLVTAIPPAGAQGLPEGKGKEQFERICRNCHPVDVATRTRHDKEGWAGVVEDMVARGAQGKQDDLKQVVDYLATNFGPNNPVGSASASAAPAPAAPSAPQVDESASKPGDAAHGKAVYAANGCSGCHQIGQSGSRVGPDLTEIGANRSYDQLQKAVVAPDDEVLPENRSARVVLKDGTTVTGKLLNQDGFSVQLLDSKEQLRSFLRSDLREYTILTKGLMPSYQGKLSPSDLADLTKYLASLKGDSKP
ncbi:MAG: c-type cytochrome [Bryobacteraceae bacterium]